MDKEQKVQVVFEFDRSEYDAYLFYIGGKTHQEKETVWEEMSKEPVIAKTEEFGDQEQMMKLTIISLAILSVKDKVEKQQGKP